MFCVTALAIQCKCNKQ